MTPTRADFHRTGSWPTEADLRPSGKARGDSWQNVAVTDARVRDLIASLVAHHVAVTSTLPVFESSMMGRPPIQKRVLDAMSAAARDSYLTLRAASSSVGSAMALPDATFRKEMDFERAFAQAGGLLLAGPDPTGNGGVLPGYGDQRESSFWPGRLPPVEADGRNRQRRPLGAPGRSARSGGRRADSSR
jgi:hypothetical protein